MRVVLLVALVLFMAVAGCGGDSQEIVVPYVTGLNEQLASDVAEEAGLHVRIEHERTDDAKKGFVYEQSLREGSSVEQDSELTIWVSSGGR